MPHAIPAVMKPKAGEMNPAPMLVNTINATINMYEALCLVDSLRKKSSNLLIISTVALFLSAGIQSTVAHLLF
jgi:hypothetical protein